MEGPWFATQDLQALTSQSSNHISDIGSLTLQSPFLTLLTPDHSLHRLPLLIPQTQSLTPSVASKEAHHSPYRLLIAHLINAPCSPYRFCITDRTDSPKFSTQTAYYFPYCLHHSPTNPCVALCTTSQTPEKPHYSPHRVPSLSKKAMS